MRDECMCGLELVELVEVKVKAEGASAGAGRLSSVVYLIMDLIVDLIVDLVVDLVVGLVVDLVIGGDDGVGGGE